MRTIIATAFLILLSTTAFSQKKEKIKGSRIVTLQTKEISPFDNIEVGDNVEIFLIKGAVAGIEIEADDNLHDAIGYKVSAGTLLLNSLSDVTSAKKFSVRVTYTSDLDLIVARNNVMITALNDMDLANLTIKLFDSARFFGTVKGNEVTITANDKTRHELNLTAQKINIEASKNATVKAHVSATTMNFDMYQKSSASIEGNVVNLKLRLDGDADFSAKGLSATNAELLTEGQSECKITVSTKAIIDASGKSKIELSGEPKIEIRKFTDSATLAKKLIR